MWRWIDAWLGNVAGTMQAVSRVEVIGTTHVLIEHHRGLVIVAFAEVVIALLRGTVQVRGQRLVVRTMTHTEIVIDGLIEHVFWDHREDQRG